MIRVTRSASKPAPTSPNEVEIAEDEAHGNEIQDVDQSDYRTRRNVIYALTRQLLRRVAHAAKTGKPFVSKTYAKDVFDIDTSTSTNKMAIKRAKENLLLAGFSADEAPDSDSEDEGEYLPEAEDAPAPDRAPAVNRSNVPNRVGHSGRKPKPPRHAPLDKLDRGDEYGQHGCTWPRYVQILRECTTEMLTHPEQARWAKSGELSARLKERQINISARTIYERAKHDGDPARTGGQILPAKVEKDLADTIKYLRTMKQPLWMDDIIAMVECSIDGTQYEDKFPNGVSTGWFYGFLKRNDLQMGHLQPIEATREAWMTPANLLTYYNVAQNVLLESGIAVVNPDFDPDVEYSQPILIPEENRWRILSYDETDVSLGTDHTSKKKSNKTVVGLAGEDDGAVVTYKSSGKITATAGRNGAGQSLSPYICYQGGIPERTHECWAIDDHGKQVWRQVELENSITDEDGNAVEIIYSANAKGSMNSERCLDFLNKITAPSLPGMKPQELMCVEFIDGCNCHLSYERLKKAQEIGLGVILRLPNSTSRTQGEDTVLFRKLKPLFQKQKRKVQRQKAFRNRGIPVGLSKDDLWTCLEEPWNATFNKEKIMHAWEKDGLIPFDRKVYWDVKKEFEKRAELAASFKDATGIVVNPKHVIGITNDDNDDDDSGSDAEAGNTNRGAAHQDQRELLAAVDKIPTSGSFAEMLADEASSPLAVKLIGMLKDIKRKRDGADAAPPPAAISKSRKTLTASALYHLDGSATGPQAMALVKKKHEEKKTKEGAKLNKEKDKRLKGSMELEEAVEKWQEVRADLHAGKEGVIDDLSRATLGSVYHALKTMKPKQGQTKPDLIREILQTDQWKEAAAVGESARAGAGLAG